MKITQTTDSDYWGVVPAGVPWAAAVVGAGDAQGLKSSMYLLGDADDERSPVAAIVSYPPLWVLPRHSHDSDRFEIVISGTVEVDGKWLRQGDVWTSSANQFYGPHNVGPEGCTTLELMSASGGRRLAFDMGDGTVNVDFTDPSSLAAAAAGFASTSG